MFSHSTGRSASLRFSAPSQFTGTRKIITDLTDCCDWNCACFVAAANMH